MKAFVFSSTSTFLMILVIGYMGYRLFKYLHIPGGAITGPLVMVAVFSIEGAVWTDLPNYIVTVFQVIIGIMIGCRFSKEKVSQLKSLIVPGLMVSVWMLCTGLTVGIIMSKITGFDLGTSLYGAVPGGIAEMGIIALSYNLNVSAVSMYQFVRVITVNLFVPIIAYKFGHTKREVAVSKDILLTDIDEEENEKGHAYLITLIIGGCSGFIARNAGIPVGGMMGAMIVVGLLRSVGVSLKKVPRWIFIFAQIGLGGYLGTTFTANTIAVFQQLLLTTLLFSLIIVLNGIALGFLVNRFFGWDLTTSLLACAAGGASQMGAIALDMNADVVTVGLIQTIRLVMILLLMPSLITYLIG